MNATVLPGPSAPRRLSRNAVIVAVVVSLHFGLIWALQSGLLLRTAELIVPVEVLAQLIEPPAPRPETAPPAMSAPSAQPARPSLKIQKQAAPKIPVLPQPSAVSPPVLNAAVAPADSPLPAAPAPMAEAPVAPTAPPLPAPAAVQLPSSDADYLQNPKPAYPALSKRLGEQGKVVVRVLIGTDGVPQQAELRQSSGFDRLDQAAVSTVLKWRYVPGKRGGVAEAMWFSVPINFVLE